MAETQERAVMNHIRRGGMLVCLSQQLGALERVCLIMSAWGL